MSERRAAGWVTAIAFAGALYVVSVIVTGKAVHNGAWLLMVIVFVSAAADVVMIAIRGRSSE